MTDNLPENKAQEPSTQQNVDVNAIQTKQEATATQSQPMTPETQEDPNWRAFREARKKDRAEREAAERRAAEKEAEATALKAAMEAAFAKNAPSPSAYKEYYGMNQEANDETEDQRIEKKVNALLAKKETEYEKQRYERELQEYPTRLIKDFPDFNQVIAQENRDYLDYHFPEISRPLSRLQEGYDKWHDIYHAIKKLVPNQANVRKDAMKADHNLAKPKSISSTGITQAQPTPGSHILSDEKKAANWARMQASLKGVG